MAALAGGEAGGACGRRPRGSRGRAGARGRGPRRAAGRSPRSRRGGRPASSPAGRRRSVSASSSARSRWAPGATTSLTRPIRSASSASTGRPVRISSRARPMPTTRGRRWVPPSTSGTPQRRSKKPKVEPGVAIRRSHQRASSRPPARHQPSTAAIAGFEGVRRLKPIGPAGSSTSRSSALRSAPAQKASPPAPVRTRTRAPSSASNSSKPWRSSLGGGAVDGVAALGPVDRQHRRRADPLVANLVAHRRHPRTGHWASVGRGEGGAGGLVARQRSRGSPATPNSRSCAPVASQGGQVSRGWRPR